MGIPSSPTKTRNTPDEIIKDLVQENESLKLGISRAHWKNRNQKNEIKRLNRALIEKNHIISSRDTTVNYLNKKLSSVDAQGNPLPTKHDTSFKSSEV